MKLEEVIIILKRLYKEYVKKHIKKILNVATFKVTLNVTIFYMVLSLRVDSM